MAERYKNAWKCHKCPRSNEENGCPAWNEVVMTETSTGEQKIVKGCTFQLMPWLITESIKASNTSSATSSDIKNEVARGYSLLARVLPGFAKALASEIQEETREDENKLKLIKSESIK